MIPALGEVDTKESLELSGQMVSVDQCCLVLVRDPAYKNKESVIVEHTTLTFHLHMHTRQHMCTYIQMQNTSHTHRKKDENAYV